MFLCCRRKNATIPPQSIWLILLACCVVVGCTPVVTPLSSSEALELTCPSLEDEFPLAELVGEPPVELAGTWKLSSWYKGGEIISIPFEETIAFGTNRMLGDDSCNQMGFFYAYAHPVGQLCEGSMTLLGCGPTMTRIVEIDEYGNETVISETVEEGPNRYDEPYPHISNSSGFEWKDGALWFYTSPNQDEALIFRQQ